MTTDKQYGNKQIRTGVKLCLNVVTVCGKEDG